jgi:hypothetical protein
VRIPVTDTGGGLERALLARRASHHEVFPLTHGEPVEDANAVMAWVDAKPGVVPLDEAFRECLAGVP